MAGFHPDRSGFHDLARRGRLAFVYREVLADALTPVSTFARLGRGPYSFLLESVVGGEKWAAYSFLGVRPRAVLRARAGMVEILRPEGADFVVAERRAEADPFAALGAMVREHSVAVPPGLPRFFGGAVGWLGYDGVRWFEKLPAQLPDELGLPEACFALTDTVVIFDNLRGTLKVVASVDVAAGDPDRAYDDACARIEAVLDRSPGARSDGPLPPLEVAPLPPGSLPEPRARTPQADYEASVRRIQEYIKAGDAFQVVLSQRFDVPRQGVDPVRRLPAAAGDQPVAVHVPPGVPRGRRHRRLARVPGAPGRPQASRCAPSLARAAAGRPPRTTPPWRRSCARTRRNWPNTSC